MTIKAIETRYAGCRFRSRLEARWARFFDHLRIRWEYEPEGFETAAGPYLPDFRIRIPQFKNYGHHQWFEVKPDDAADDPRHVAFATGIAEPVIIARGLPRDYLDQHRGTRSPLQAYNIRGIGDLWPVAFCDSSDLSYDEHYCSLGDNRHWCMDSMNHMLPGETCHLALYGYHPPYVDTRWPSPEHWTFPPGRAHDIDAAYAAARSARFEHGEQG